MNSKRLGKALDIMRLAEEAAARPGGICLVQITNTFGVTLRTAQRMTRALEKAFPMVQTRTDSERRKWWQLPDSRVNRRNQSAVAWRKTLLLWQSPVLVGSNPLGAALNCKSCLG
mgnify:CR=1 FL=1